MVRLTAPVEPEPTMATMVVEEITVNEVTCIPPRVTAKVFIKLVPVMVITIPEAAAVGVKAVMVGAGIKVKPSSDEVPPGVVKLTAPVEPEPTLARMEVGETTVKEFTGVPPSVKAKVPVKLVPLIVSK